MSSDHEQLDARSPPAESTAPPTTSGGLATIVFFLILAAGVGLLSFVFLVRPAWLGQGEDLDSYPKLAALSLMPVLSEDEPLELADLKGKVVLLNFWGPWCEACVYEFPDILALEQEYRDRTDFKVLAVSCGRGADEAKEMPQLRVDTQAFLEHRFVKMPVYLDPDQKTRAAVLEVAAQRVLHFEKMQMPVTLLLDREHRVRVVWVGRQSKQAFAAQIERLLNERP